MALRAQKEHRGVWVIAILSLFVVYCLRCFDSSLIWYDDVLYLYNRCFQMVDCLKHGLYPFLYYNDVGGIGYGSPIFYGQLTLFPFIPFVGSADLFIRVYYLACLLLNFFGFRFFLKRLSENATVCSVFYILGMPFIYLYSYSLQAALMGTGFSWFFFGYCIDFFRDRRHLPQTVLFFFLVYQSNMNSAIFAVFACFCLFLVYFDKSRLKDYVRLFVCCLLLLSYNIVNILVHLDDLRIRDGNALFDGPNGIEYSAHLMSIMPFGEYIVRAAVHDSLGVDMCCGFMSFSLWLLFAYYLVVGFRKESKRFRFCACCLLAVTVVLYVAGIYKIWPSLYDALGGVLFFQFPIRYVVLLFGFVIVVLSRVMVYDKVILWLLVISLMDMMLAGPMTWRGEVVGGDSVAYVHYQLYNAEYAGRDFVNDLSVIQEYSGSVHSASGADYGFVNEYNGLSVDCSPNPGVDTLTLPKLYYYGYEVVDSNGEIFSVASGYSNYCEVNIGSYTGVLRLSYRVPAIVMTFFVVQVACFFILLFVIFSSLWRKKLECFPLFNSKTKP